MNEPHPLLMLETEDKTANGNMDALNKNDFDSWPNPKPIKATLPPVEPFPFKILPEPLMAWVKDISHRMQCPADFVATAALVLISSIIGTRCGIRPKRNDDWLVIPNLWGAVVGRPSMLKTPALNEALKSLSRLEAEAKESLDKSIKSYEMDLFEYQARKEGLRAEMKKVATDMGKRTMESIREELSQLEEPARPTMRRYKTNDATIEKLSELLNENPAGLLLFRDEMVGLLASWDKPGRESDRAFFLEAWDGQGSHTSDRIGRGTIFTKNLCVSVLGGIQPAKATKYLYQSMNGLENDGLIQRFQLLVFPDEPKDWYLVDKTPDKQAKDRVFRIIQQLVDMDFAEFGATKDGPDDFLYFHFSEEAQQVFNDWLTDLQLNKLMVDDHPMVIEHLGKYRSLMPSLALIFHSICIADGATADSVSLSSAEKAAAWCDYLETHQRRFYGLAANIVQQAAVKLSEKIQAGKLSDGFTVRDVYRQNWHLLNNKELAQPACDELVDAGWLRPEVTKSSFKQKGKVEYRINPKI